MGKSTASCFKMIACGGDSVEHDDLQTAESKSSSDRRGWSFRKRSARQRILSNSVTTEVPASENKEIPDSTAVNFQVQPDLTTPEKPSVVHLTEEKNVLSTQLDIKVPDNLSGAKEDDSGADATLDEPSIIVIQAAIRGLLAQQVLLKQKNIVKLQAVIRGHLVRRYAVGTLRCVQAIVRMQSLVRARLSRVLEEGLGDYTKQSEGSGNNSNGSTLLRKRKQKLNGSHHYVSMDKLLSNAFARQLLESTPRTTPINIKCDPSKSDSAWIWLERWMSVSSITSEQPHESDSDVELGKEHLEHDNGKDEVLVPSECDSEPTGFHSVATASAEAPNKDDKVNSDDKMIMDDPSNSDIHSFQPISPSSSHSEMESIDGSNSRYETTEPVSIEIEEMNLTEKVKADSLPEEETNEQDRSDSTTFSAEQHEAVATKNSRKPSNPAFIAAQSKFEELSSVAPGAKIIKSSIPDSEDNSSVEKVSSSTDQPLRTSDFGIAENTGSKPSTVQIDDSECGTELSISSTLDSPARSETGINGVEQKTKVPEEETDCDRSKESLEHEANGKTIILEPDSADSKSDKLERFESINSVGESSDSLIAVDPSQQDEKTETKPNELQPELATEASCPINKSSPEASPRSHITFPDSQATPSTESSVKPKKNKGKKSESNHKTRSSSADKKSLSNQNQDSASRSSLEHSQEHKTGKRRNSLGSAKPDHKEHVTRDSSSTNSLPSYMQATESARAKAIANGSPRSSPDVHEKDIHIKKRHSLPSSNERQGSPHIQRSLSQAQQNAKANVTHSPQERMWRR
ncbi:protein IQ-DOMAIN 32-like [Andrographis paniculata]|uniref:protein IQ-DOMAIN 32-like n=1 Tax=Andrographis paniculata TaxID=175694 RepID=UPI0021E8F47C|nr:protein IQ-DOMAIN 32-like [Andrographis paniculata]